MPEAPRNAGSKRTRARGPSGALVMRRALDGAEHSGSIERVMAGRHAARYGFRRDQQAIKGGPRSALGARRYRARPRDAWPCGDLSRHTVQINTDDPTHLTKTLLRDVGHRSA
jgi:hypothetical protein